MSADNWTLCPQCKAEHLKRIDEMQQKVSRSYGKDSVEVYIGRVADLTALLKAEQPQTMREDYSLGVDENGEFSCSYRCSCTECCFSYTFSTKVEPDQVLRKGPK